MQEFFKYGWLFKEIWGRCTHIFFIFHLCIYIYLYLMNWKTLWKLFLWFIWQRKSSANHMMSPPPALNVPSDCLQVRWVCACVRARSAEKGAQSHRSKLFKQQPPLSPGAAGPHVLCGERTRMLLCKETEAEPTWPLLRQSHRPSGLRLRYPLSALWVGGGVKGWEDRRHLLAGQMGSELRWREIQQKLVTNRMIFQRITLTGNVYCVLTSSSLCI